MNIRLLLTTLTLILATQGVYAQKQNNVWCFGGRAGVDFNTGSPFPLIGCQIGAGEGCASIADRNTGQLLFYTDGLSVRNRQHNIMPNGQGLRGGVSSTQAALIVPMPGDASRYYVFSNFSAFDGVFYSIVDMTLDNGLGDVIAPKAVPLIDTTTEKLVAVRSCDGNYWVITHRKDDTFYAFKVTSSGISTPVVSSVGKRIAPIGTDTDWMFGYLKASPDGKRLAAAWSWSGIVEVYDFDGVTGQVTNAIPIAVDYSQGSRIPYGVSFSPDSRTLYVSTASPSDTGIPKDTASLFQFDVTRRDAALVAKSKVAIAGGTHGALQLAPDGKLYCVRPSLHYLSVIEKPNFAGKNCMYSDSAVYLVGLCRLGLPNMIDADGDEELPYPHASPDTTICRGSTVVISALGGIEYLWGPEAVVPCSACPAMAVTPDSTTIYTVTITRKEGCQFFDTVVVTVVDAVTADAGKDTLICSGGSTQLHGVGGDSTHWSPSEGLSCTDCRDPIASPTKTTTYTLTTSNAAGCTASDKITVTVWSGAVASADTTICAGQSAQLRASGGVRYAWSPGTDLSCSDCPDPIARPTKTTRYYVTAYSEAGCSAIDSVLVTVIGDGSVDAGLPQSICRGDSMRLSASDGAAWQWSPVDGLSCADCRTPMASPSATTLYTVTVSAAGGCTASDTVTVTVFDLPTIYAGSDTAICAGGATTLHASGSTTHRWSPAAGLSCTDCADPIATPTATTTYHVTATNVNGCSATDSVTVTVIDAASVDAGPPQMICSGDGALLRATDGVSWKWSPSTGLSCSDCRSPMAGPSVTTLYTVEVSGAGGCSASDTVSVTVLPLPLVTAGNDVAICVGGSAQLHASGGASYRWSPADGLSCSDCPDPLASPSSTTTYTLTGTSVDGCTASDDITVTLLPARTIRAHIDRDYRTLPGGTRAIPVMLDDVIGEAVDTLSIALNYNGGILRLRGSETAGTLLDGWRKEVITDTIGGTSLRFIATGDNHLRGTGSLLVLSIQAFLGDTIASELPFTLSLGEQPCLTVRTAPGLIALDSICGLSFRLIESNATAYTLKQNAPNPFNPTTEIAFTLGLDGATRLEVFDVAGARVAMLLDEYLAAGSYAVMWDATMTPSGLYHYRLTSGTWSRIGRMVLVK